MADRIKQDQGTDEGGQVVGQGVQLQPHSIGGGAATGQPGSRNRILALLDVLLVCGRRACTRSI